MAEILFGVHAVATRLQHAPETIRALFVEAEHARKQPLAPLLALAKQRGIACHTRAQKALAAMVVPHAVHQGIVAELCAEESRTSTALLPWVEALTHSPLLLILDGVQDPHNLGACLRTANAAGVDAVIIPKDRASPLNSTARKVASGGDQTPVFTVTNIADTLRGLKALGVWLFGMDHAATDTVYTAPLTGSIAVVLGAEGAGLRRLTKEHCDYLMRIPQYGVVESLNVSVAAGIALFEVKRRLLV